MARAASRRQVKPAAPPATNLISKYGRVSKAQAIPVEDLKKAFYIDLPSYHQIKTAEVSIKTEESPVKPLATPAATPSSRKRKAVSIEDESPSKNSRSNAPSADTLKRQRMTKDGWNDKPVPVKKELVSPITTTATSLSTAKKAATSAVDTHRKARKSTVISQAKTEVRKANVKASRSKRHNAPAVPAIEAEEPVAKQLPAELLELLDMQRAILKTVSIQVIHQGSNSPIDIGAITPHVSRTWGKRKVTTDDIRRCIAIQDMRPAGREQEMLGSPFIVTDYGRGKLYLEMDLGKVSSGPINEQMLCQQFEENLRVICADRATDEMTDLDACFENLSFADLPKSDITVRHDAAKRSAVLARGQRALTELKNGITIKKQEKESKALGAKIPALNADGTKMSLLDRIKAKEAANAHIQLPTGPELIRKRALQRVSDIAAIISMLVASSGAAGQAVMSFQMAVLQQKLKDSVRVPMPMEEGVEVVRIIANEVAPEWLRLATVGGKEHVVIQTRRKPYDVELAARVNRLS